jgi:hypothetical protein
MCSVGWCKNIEDGENHWNHGMRKPLTPPLQFFHGMVSNASAKGITRIVAAAICKAEEKEEQPGQDLQIF